MSISKKLANVSLKRIIIMFFLIFPFWLPIALDFSLNVPNAISFALFLTPIFIFFFLGFFYKPKLVEVIIGSTLTVILLQVVMIIDANLHVEGGWLHDSVNMSWPLFYLVSTIVIVPLVFSLIFATGSLTRKKLLKGSS